MLDNSKYLHIANSVALTRISNDEFNVHRGEFAILVNGCVHGFHKTNREAILEARRRFPDSHFSVRRVEPQPADLGFIAGGNDSR